MSFPVTFLAIDLTRRSSIWPNATQFTPDRWLHMEREPTAFKFIAFNAGLYLCRVFVSFLTVSTQALVSVLANQWRTLRRRLLLP